MPRKPYKYHFIYKITNIINNKFYVGMHSTNNINDSYFGSGRYLHRSIKKYGKQNFKREILEFLDTREKLIKREEIIITSKLLNDPLCMNLNPGGKGGRLSGFKHTQKMKDKNSKALSNFWKNNKKGNIIKCEVCKKEVYCSPSRIPSKYCSKKCAYSMHSKTMKVAWNNRTDENKKNAAIKISKSLTNKTATIAMLEGRRKHSLKMKGQPTWNKGKTGVQIAWNKGKRGIYVATDETRKKLSESLMGHDCLPETRKKIADKNSIKILQYDLDNNFIKKWDSTQQVARTLKISAGNICMCLKNKRNSASGFVWKYSS